MEAAITLADRGHQVILAEKSGRLGGAIRFAGHVSFKSKLDQLMQVLIRRVERRKITVMLNTGMTPELARSLRPDAIVCAIGAIPSCLLCRAWTLKSQFPQSGCMSIWKRLDRM